MRVNSLFAMLVIVASAIATTASAQYRTQFSQQRYQPSASARFNFPDRSPIAASGLQTIQRVRHRVSNLIPRNENSWTGRQQNAAYTTQTMQSTPQVPIQTPSTPAANIQRSEAYYQDSSISSSPANLTWEQPAPGLQYWDGSCESNSNQWPAFNLNENGDYRAGDYPFLFGNVFGIGKFDCCDEWADHCPCLETTNYRSACVCTNPYRTRQSGFAGYYSRERSGRRTVSEYFQSR